VDNLITNTHQAIFEASWRIVNTHSDKHFCFSKYGKFLKTCHRSTIRYHQAN